MPSDLVIVYHRQPYEEVEEEGRIVLRENQPNGIVPTLKSFFGRVEKGAWVAWKQADDPADPGFERVIEIEDSHGRYAVSRLALTPEQVSSFYHVTSKEAFWPILHSFKERYNYDPVDWPTFREVNWSFAEAAAAEAAPDAAVWVHDYNLWLVPGYLRTLRPDLRISFFHHTPFPGGGHVQRAALAARDRGKPAGLRHRRLPHPALRGQLRHRRAQPDRGARSPPGRPDPGPGLAEGTALNERGRPPRCPMTGDGSRSSQPPVGVEPPSSRPAPGRPRPRPAWPTSAPGWAGRKLILSVSRTDYTKGNIEQLESFERLLEGQRPRPCAARCG
jgi:trehalose-6-phosphate synthase